MGREEIENLLIDFDEMGFCPTTICEDPEEYAIQWRNNMRNAIENHENDLLKEFVEWYKERLVHIQEHEKELLDDDVKHEYSYLVEYRKGTTDMLDRLLLHIDDNLERFLEERK